MGDRQTLGDLPDNTALIMCESVLNRERPIGYVDFEEDAPQAICDLDHQSEPPECNAKVVHLRHLFEWEPELGFLRDLELNHCAWWDGDRWHIEPLTEGADR